MIRKLILFIILICISGFAQTEERVVAKVGDYKIYESEFRERFDFSIHPNLLNNKDKLEAKREFLKQLIAEKLLSLNAREKGYVSSEDFSNIMIPLSNMFVRDALYKKEIKDNVIYSPNEISEGFNRIQNILKVKFIYSKNQEEIKEIYSNLIAGASFDSLLSFRKESKDQQVPREVTFGTMEKSIEDSIYKLQSGEFTKPLQSKDGFYILKLVDIVPNPDLKGQDMVLEDVKRIVETREEYKIYLNYYRNFFPDYKVTADKEIFEQLIKSFVFKFKTKYLFEREESQEQIAESAANKFYLSGNEVTSSYQTINDDLRDKVFINLNDKQIKINTFLNQLSHDRFHVKDTSELSIRASLSSYIRKFIEDQLLTAEGTKSGLNKLPKVEKYLSMWRDSYLSKMLIVDFFDSIKVSEEEAFSIYEQNEWKNTPMELVNVAEVLTDSLQVVETVLNELSKGRNIKDLAKQYTKRDSLRERGGEFGYFPVTEHGEIGRAALKMNVGDVYGPVKVEDGYSVFQLLDRVTDTTTSSKSYEEIKKDLITHLTLIKFEKFVNSYNAQLANKYGVEINEDVLKDIDNIFLNLVVVRYMGFGGEIFAVPYTEQFSGWYDIWMQNKDVVQ